MLGAKPEQLHVNAVTFRCSNSTVHAPAQRRRRSLWQFVTSAVHAVRLCHKAAHSGMPALHLQRLVYQALCNRSCKSGCLRPFAVLAALPSACALLAPVTDTTPSRWPFVRGSATAVPLPTSPCAASVPCPISSSSVC